MITTRPAELPRYATDTTISGGPQIGLATRLRPSNSLLDQGIRQDKRVPARILGWLLGTVGDWLGHLDTKALHGALQSWRRSETMTGGTMPGPFAAVVGVLGRSVLDTNGDQQRAPVWLSVDAGAGTVSQSHSGDGSYWQVRANIAGAAYMPATSMGALAGDRNTLIVWGENTTAKYSTNAGTSWSTVANIVGETICGYHYLQNALAINHYLKLGTDGIVYDSQGNPGVVPVAHAAVTSNAFPGATFADDGAGHVVICCQYEFDIRVGLFYSADYGVTWALAQAVLPTGAGNNADVVYNKYHGKFVCVATDGKIWTSTTGAPTTWSQFAGTTATTANGFLSGRGTIATAGPAIAKFWRKTFSGTYAQEGVAYSFDLGVNWNFAPFASNTSTFYQIQSIAGFNGRFYAAGLDNVWVSGLLDPPRVEA